MRRINRGSIKNMIHGAGTVLDLYPAPVLKGGMRLVFFKAHGSVSDAIKSDWEKVGSSISGVMGRESKTYGEK